LLDAAVPHHRHPVRQRERFLLVVGHVDGGDSQGLLQEADLLAHLLADLGVQVRQGLVEQEDVGVQDQRTGQRHPLLLAARELAGVAVLQPPQVHLAQAALQPLGDLGGGQLAQPQAVGDVAAHGHVRPQRVVLEHHADVPLVGRQGVHAALAEADLALVRWTVEPRDEP
jgi:hypothetical protein